MMEPKAAQLGPNSCQGPKLGKMHIVQIFSALEDIPSIVNLKIILSTCVQGQERAARGERNKTTLHKTRLRQQKSCDLP